MWVNGCVWMCVYEWMCVHEWVHMCVQMDLCACISVYKWVYECVCVCVCVSMSEGERSHVPLPKGCCNLSVPHPLPWSLGGGEKPPFEGKPGQIGSTLACVKALSLPLSQAAL